jgi:hypothetical protein
MCGCGGGGAASTAYPMTSGDYVDNGPERWKVVSKTEVDPDTQMAVVLSTHSDYRLASIEASRVGGKVRTIST